MLTLLPKDANDVVYTFDKLRYTIKAVKSSKKRPNILLQQYQAASAEVKGKLLEQFQTNYQEIQKTTSTVVEKELLHQNNVIKRILSHEWNITTPHNEQNSLS